MPKNPFGKNLSEIEFADIEKLKETSRAENEYLEYTEEMPNRIDLQKEVLGFANNKGGYLIIGIREKPEGTPEEIVGINKESNLKERIVSIVRDNSSPSYVPNIQLLEMPSDSTKCIIIVYSHESDTIHRASDGHYYYRSENQTIPLTPDLVAKIIGKQNIDNKLKEIVEKLDWKEMPERTEMSIGDHCWLSILCCPIPPDGLRISVFSETGWYYDTAVEAISTAGVCMFDKRSTTDSFRVYKVRANATKNAMVEYFENGIVSYCNLLFGREKSIYEGELQEKLGKFLSLVAKVYGKASFEGGLLLIVGLGNIAGWSWTIGNFLKDDAYDIEPSSTAHLETKHETTVLALQSDITSVLKLILAKLKRHFNIH